MPNPPPAAVDFARPAGDPAAVSPPSDSARTAPGDPPAPSPGARRGVIAAAWARATASPSTMIVAQTAVISVLRLVSNIALARLLAPSAFALTAITSLILTGIQMVSDIGVAITALREGGLARGDEDRMWSMQLVRGVGIALVMVALAAPAGWIYHNPQLRDVLLALALMPILQEAASLYPVLALSRRRLLPTTLVELGGRVITMTASILVALVEPTVWALVAGTLLGCAFMTLSSHIMAGRWPRFVFDPGFVKKQWRFTRWIQTSSSLTFVGAQIDKAAFPFLFGMTALGVYGIAATLASMPSQITSRWSANVFYPLAVEMLRGGDAARARLMSVRRTMLLYILVVTATTMAVAPSFFLLLYAPRYHAAAAIAVVLGAGAFFEVAEASLRHLPLIEDSPQFEVWAVLVRLAGFAACVGIVVLTGAGIAGYALAYVGGLASSHLFMLATCVRRGYLRPGFDLLALALLAVIGTAIYVLPLGNVGKLALIAEGVVVALIAAAAMLVIYWRRGLPSLPAEPAPHVLRETAEEELGLRLEGNLPIP